MLFSGQGLQRVLTAETLSEDSFAFGVTSLGVSVLRRLRCLGMESKWENKTASEKTRQRFCWG